MVLDKFLKRWHILHTENLWSRCCIVLLTIVSILSITLAFKKETIVVMQPYPLEKTAQLSRTTASASLHEAWGMCFANLIGNVSPYSADFVRERLIDFMAPQTYKNVLKILNAQVDQIKNNRFGLGFTPKSVEYEPTTSKVFIWGDAVEHNLVSSAERRAERTYEFSLKFQNYRPLLVHIDTYIGPPKTKEFLKEQQKKI